MIFSSKAPSTDPCAILTSKNGDKEVRTTVAITKEDGTTVIDVRGLEPPQPLVEIISLLESADVSDTVIVHHDRDPLLLYPELDDRGWAWSELPSPEGELHLRLTRNAGAETN